MYVLFFKSNIKYNQFGLRPFNSISSIRNIFSRISVNCTYSYVWYVCRILWFCRRQTFLVQFPHHSPDLQLIFLFRNFPNVNYWDMSLVCLMAVRFRFSLPNYVQTPAHCTVRSFITVLVCFYAFSHFEFSIFI